MGEPLGVRSIISSHIPRVILNLLGSALQWMLKVEEATIAELRAFALKLRQDIKAVVAAMVMPYSQGQTEGRITKLKLVKRSMYGRGTFDLLRHRVLYVSAA